MGHGGGLATLLTAVDARPLTALAAATLSLVVAYCLLPAGTAPLAAPRHRAGTCRCGWV